MSKIKNGGLDQYGAEPFEPQQFGTADVERVKLGYDGDAETTFADVELNKRLCYCRGTARRPTSVEILWPFFD